MKTGETTFVQDAVQQLFYPSFFDRDERKAAYNLVMLWGSEDERFQAEQAKNKFPFDEPEETLFSSQEQDNFPIVSNPHYARFGE